jgi:hypothetical protein
VRRVKVLGLPTLSMLLFGCGTDAADFSASQSNPVITRVADAKIPYPVASVSGRLSLRRNCLMIGEGFVFWRARPGTTRNAESSSEQTFATRPKRRSTRSSLAGWSHPPGRPERPGLRGEGRPSRLRGKDRSNACPPR